MAKLSTSEVKRLITAMQKRRELERTQANRAVSAAILSSQRNMQKRLQPVLAKTGLDLKKLGSVVDQNQKELRRVLEKNPTPPDSSFAGTRETIRRAVEGRANALELANRAQPQGASTFVLLDAPFLIFALPSNWLFDSHVSRKESFAKVRFQETLSQFLPKAHTVYFVYVWENPSDQHALVNIETYIVLKGFCEASVDRPTNLLYATSDLHVGAELEIFEWWNQQPTTPLPQKTQKVEAVHLHCNAFGPFSPGETKTQNIFDGYDLKYSLFVVPPKGVVVFYISMFTKEHAFPGRGSFIADFSFKDSLVLCPYLQLELLTQP